jgi:putative DNA primase/helicase
MLVADMAARVSRGDSWPCDEGRAPQGDVILLSAEDDASDTVVPRLLAAGADLDRIEIIKMVRDTSKRRMFSLVTDLPLLREKIAAIGDVKLVQIDPISAYLRVGKVDSFRTTRGARERGSVAGDGAGAAAGDASDRVSQFQVIGIRCGDAVRVPPRPQ